ncbi:glycosyl hydrolase [Sphingomonas sp. PP-CC-3A-396]|uniref:glycoside hydrolase family 26 protein n=1 Tax=Sphingomonas sp. PP-CC-3A-396 TaxID=2135655 RepID=UPI001053933A|nr:glycosyl hydrolase [Sphingomonas sp. PP-CC-3A-396]TCQ03019.1 glycosyl hydrolase family 26 [Sphingomonas sp. PP-CC-3A-396]
MAFSNPAKAKHANIAGRSAIILIAAAVAVAGGALIGLKHIADPGAAPAEAAPLPVAMPLPATVEFGAHVGAGCDGRAAIPAFEALAGRKLQRTVDAIDQRDWKSMRSSAGWLSHCWSDAPINLTISVPMIPNGTQSTLAQGAKGVYDDVFREIATTLVKDRLAHATLRIGWEFNGDWMPWSAAKDPTSYIAFFRRIVGIVRAVPGQYFTIEWTPGVGRHAIAPDRAYPGDDVVDLIGMDVYNEFWDRSYTDTHMRFGWLRDQPYGMAWLRDFAAAHRKPTAYSEWGSGTRPDGHGGGDDPYFITQMAIWFAATRPAYQSYWEVNDPGHYDDTLASGHHPRAAAAFKAAFAAPSTSSRQANGAGKPL